MEQNWNLESLYVTDDAWDQDFIGFKDKTIEVKKLLEGLDFKKNLDKVLKAILSLEEGVSKIYTYAHLKYDEDLTNSKYKEMYGKALFLHSEYAKDFCFVEPKILEIKKEVFDEIINKPELKDYRFYLEKIYRQKPHTLDHEKEHLLALSGPALDGPAKAFSAFNNADLDFADVENEKGEKKPLSHGLYGSYLREKDRTLRKNTFESMHNGFLSYQNTLCELLSGQVSKHIFVSKARNYPSSLDAALFANNIDTSVYHNLIETVHENISSLHDFISLKKKILGVDELYPYDLYAPIIEDCKLETEYQEGCDLVIDSVSHLGKEYQDILEKGLKKDGWVDVFESKGKRSGAYSSGCYSSHPYILLNYQNTLNDLFTLAHEAGHSMHSYLSCHSQPYHYSQYSIFPLLLGSIKHYLCF
jgi:oligoendopeptidase F